jgi:16S rRNA (uracil1498-N3)-methyltransferase
VRDAVGETNLRRWRRAAAEAAKQCGRADVPEVDAPVPLAAALEAVAGDRMLVADPAVDCGTVACTEGGGVALFVGPEGGLREDEAETLREAGAQALGLGALVLRVETAGVVAVHRVVWG